MTMGAVKQTMIVAALVLNLAPMEAASPARYSGNDLYWDCTDGAGDGRGPIKCAVWIGEMAFGEKRWPFFGKDGGSCFSEGVTLGQLKDITVQFLRENPQIRHERAETLVAASILRAFPACHLSAPPKARE